MLFFWTLMRYQGDVIIMIVVHGWDLALTQWTLR